MAKQKKSAWHYTPPLPITSSPLLDWPQPVAKLLGYFFGTGFVFSQRSVYLIIAVISSLYFMPDLADIRQAQGSWTLQITWMLQVWLVLLLINTVYGWFYHYIFYVWQKNDKDCKFDKRPLATNSQRFLFGSQLWDNVFLSLTSGVLVAAVFMIAFMWAFAHGYLAVHQWQDGWMWYIAAFPLIVWWTSFHFYVVHRCMHQWTWLYDKVHALHHKNINIGPWSGMAMHPVEHMIYLSSVVIHLVIPSDPIMVLFHLLYLAIGAYLGHIGYEGFYVGQRKVLAGGNFYHQLHHRYFDCNYGSPEMPWDKWFGTFHSGTEADTQAIRSKAVGNSFRSS